MGDTDEKRACSHGKDCRVPWALHDWSYEAKVAEDPEYANTQGTGRTAP